jgi:pilus assembly protein Flp/PilA
MLASGNQSAGTEAMSLLRSFVDLSLRFLRSTDGATAIEYSVLGALVAVAIVVGATALGGRLGVMYQAVADKVIPPG